MIKNKYGNGTTKYYLTPDGYFIKPIVEKRKTFNVPDFLTEIDPNNNLFYNIMLVYNDNEGFFDTLAVDTPYNQFYFMTGCPHIDGYVNGEKAFSIILNEEQYCDLKKPNIENEYLAALMKRTITKEEYDFLLDLDKNYTKGIPCNEKQLSLYKKYLENCLDAAYANVNSDILFYLTKYAIIKSAMFIGDQNHLFIITHPFLGGVIYGICIYEVVSSIMSIGLKSVGLAIKPKKDSNLLKIKEVSKRIKENQADCEEMAKINKDFDDAMEDYYSEMKRLMTYINKLPEEDKKAYVDKVKTVKKEFKKQIRALYNVEDYKEELDALIVDGVKELYSIIPAINTTPTYYKPEVEDKRIHYGMSDNGYLITKDSNNFKRLYIPNLLTKMDTDLTNSYRLIYVDKSAIPSYAAYIIIEINGEEKYIINLDQEQKNEIDSNNIENVYLRMLMERTIDKKAIETFEGIRNEYALNGILPDDSKLLAEYKDYIKNSLKYEKGIVWKEKYTKIGPCILLGGGIETTLSAMMGNAHSTTCFEASLVLLLLAGHRVKYLMKNDILSTLYEISKKSKEDIHDYKEQLKAVSKKCKELDILDKAKEDNQASFYAIVKELAHIINSLPEEQKKEYVTEVRRIINAYKVEMKNVTTDDIAKDGTLLPGNAFHDIEAIKILK